MGIPNPDLGALEQRRLTLEDNILQLQQSLYHWRTWEAEYDGIREEIAALGNGASTEDFLEVGREFGGTLVDQKEMQKILGSQGVSRSRGQVVDLLGRRIDYVKQNVATMEKRLQAAENELHALDEQDQIPVEGGNDFPMREIMEELDENGEVISSTINTPGDQAPQLLDVLNQVGIQNIPEHAQSVENEDAVTTSPEAADQAEETPAEVSATHENHIHSSDCPVHAPEANGIVPEDDPDLERPVSLVTPEDRQQPPVTDIDESPEDARLRREMFQYGIDEVGAIVAELELDEDGSEFSLDDEDDYDFDSGEEENEDEYGRSHTVLSDEYHQQMRELEAKLNARGMYNVGKNTDSPPEEMRQDIENPPSAQDLQPNVVESDKGKKPKKRVAFAEDLDIAPAAEPTPAVAEKRTLLTKQPDVSVLSDAIVERTSRAPDARPTKSDGPKKVSRFKTARAAAPESNGTISTTTESSLKPSQPSEPGFTRKQTNAVPASTPPALFPATPKEPKPFSAPITDIIETPSGPQPPEGKTLADKLVERDIVPGTAGAPEPDELDEEMHRGQIATEFFKARNRKIQEQGGFMDEEQDTEYEYREGEIEPRRISKFRAARMK